MQALRRVFGEGIFSVRSSMQGSSIVMVTNPGIEDSRCTMHELGLRQLHRVTLPRHALATWPFAAGPLFAAEVVIAAIIRARRAQLLHEANQLRQLVGAHRLVVVVVVYQVVQVLVCGVRRAGLRVAPPVVPAPAV
mmetsp:Transcript_11963/g.29634  ORF Transcript_11963/g.29634 Transcript_11963/m.29634 type:complete len:136 (-) Transcript_11963:1016-1423(-)